MLVKDLVGGNTSGDIGIEVEMEGEHLPKAGLKHWRVEHDGSLRGNDNAEYVIRKPLKIDQVTEALAELQVSFVDSVLQPSIRTGVHVHLNVQKYTLKQVATLTTLYLVVENLLNEVCGEGRQSNLFCLKGCEAELLVHRAALFFKTEDVNYIEGDVIRYSGLNLAALPKYGSVEFRSFGSTEDMMDIKPWVDTVYNLGNLAKEKYGSPVDVLVNYSDFDPELFVRETLPLYAEQLLSLPNWEEKLKHGMRSAQDLAFSWDWKEVAEVPKPEIKVDDPRLGAFIKAHPQFNPEHLIEIWEARDGRV